MADTSDLTLVPTIEDMGREDYVIINKEKVINQITLANLLKFSSEIIPIVDRYFPKALNLKDIITEISNKLNTLQAGDIGYEGEIHKELSNVKAVLIYLLDKIDDIYNGNFDSSNITFDPSNNIPDWVMNDFNDMDKLDISAVLEYILKKYYYVGNDLDASNVKTDISGWGNLHTDGIIDENGKTSIEDAINRIYYLLNNESTIPKFYVNNLNPIELSNAPEDIVNTCTANLIKQKDGIIDISICLSIHVNIPGTLSIIVMSDGVKLAEFNNALTTGDHTLTPHYFKEFLAKDTPVILSVGLAFQKDIDDPSIKVPATVDPQMLTVIYEGIRLKYNSEVKGDDKLNE